MNIKHLYHSWLSLGKQMYSLVVIQLFTIVFACHFVPIALYDVKKWRVLEVRIQSYPCKIPLSVYICPGVRKYENLSRSN